MNLPILMTVDENYISQAKVAIYSARKATALKNSLEIILLCDANLCADLRNRLIELENVLTNVNIKFKEVNAKDFNGAKPQPNLTVAAYYKLIAINAFPYKKCIYIDGDLLVNLDLKDLYTIDITGYYVAGVSDMNLMIKPNMALQNLQDCNMTDFSDYINTGVMLMNLELMRQDHLVEMFLWQMKNERNRWLDQDVINRVCHGKIKRIDWKFNHIVGYSNALYEVLCGKSSVIGNKEIYHWAGLLKPWIDCSYKGSEEWWKLAKEILEPGVYDEIYAKAQEHTKRYYISELALLCKGEENIVIVGYSDHGMNLMRQLKSFGVRGIIVLCDNNKAKIKMRLIEHEVISVTEAAARYPGALYINAVQNDRAIIVDQLKSCGIMENRILNYYVVGCDYYLYLEKNHMRRGIDEMIKLFE